MRKENKHMLKIMRDGDITASDIAELCAEIERTAEADLGSRLSKWVLCPPDHEHVIAGLATLHGIELYRRPDGGIQTDTQYLESISRRCISLARREYKRGKARLWIKLVPEPKKQEDYAPLCIKLRQPRFPI